MRRAFIAIAAALGACATPMEEAVTPQPNSHSLPAPSAEDVAVRITQAQADTRVAVPVGARFAVELVGVPTAGYQWQAASVPDFLSEGASLGGPTTQAQTQPGFTGGNHWEVLTFAATRAGTGVLRLEMRRPWESDEPPARTFETTIEAQ